jgi:dethiobiotin synthetase
MEQGYFITGTDTDVGKTWATIALMRYFKQQGKTVVGMKPVAAGCTLQDGLLKNADALLIQENASVKLDYDLINPYAYALPVSPHIAGVNNPVNLAVIAERFNALKALAEIVVVEGAGGWYAPLNDREDISDLAKSLGLPIILVVAIRLGCINHAKLTYQAIHHSGLPCAGWIAVCLDPDLLYLDENIQTIKTALPAPLLGVLPYLDSPDFDLLAGRLVL